MGTQSTTQDDLPLPPGYECRPEREVTFLNSTTTDGLEGLAWAILLQAVADGCNPDWLAELAEYYQIQINTDLFYRRPQSVIRGADHFEAATDPFADVKRLRARPHPLAAELDIPSHLVDPECASD